MWKGTGTNTRILHFEKYMPRGIESDYSVKSRNRNQKKDQVYKSYLSCGYYDQLSYVRATANRFDYKDYFLLKYPYKASKRQIIADQVFILLDMEQSISWDDPFEYHGDRSMPFLGVILITVSGMSDNKVCPENMYERLITLLRNKCDVFLNGIVDNLCYKYFYTPNCADLCVAVRSDELDVIYRLKQYISSLKVSISEEWNECEGSFHAISYTVIETTAKAWPREIIDKNKAIWMEMRLSSSFEIMDKIKGCLPGKNVFGITGAGQYSIEMDFDRFAEIYPFLGRMKLDEPDVIDCKANTELQKYFADSNIDCSYMRAKYPLHDPDCPESGAFFCWNQPDKWVIEQYRNKMGSLLDEIYVPNVSMETMVREKIQMLKELFNTYNDFWYHPCSWWKGLWLYIQLESVIAGIRTQSELIEKYMKQKKAKENKAQELTEQLCKDITDAVAAVNNFNRLLQSNNQYVINVPNYEIQTKVNVEKYLMAYTLYLMKISGNYRRQRELPKRIVPFITLDLTVSGINTLTLMGTRESYEETESDRIEPGVENSPFVIRFPNYQWLANIYHVLPMITHEMSHNFRYMDRESRNKFAWEYILRRLSIYLLERLVEPIRTNLFIGNFEEYLLEHIYATLLEEMKTKDSLMKNVKFRDIGIYIQNGFLEITGIRDEKEKSHRRWNLIADELVMLAKETEMEFIRVQDLETVEINPKNICIIYFNLILDIMLKEKTAENKENDYCEEWLRRITGIKERTTDRKVLNVADIMINFLNFYHETGEIRVEDIFLAVRYAISSWKERDSIVVILYKNDSTFKKYLDCLMSMENLPTIKILKSESSNLIFAVNHEMTYYEKLTRMYQYVGDIMTNITYSSTRTISHRENCADRFSGKLHEKLHGNYKEKLEKRNEPENWWVTFKEEQTWLTSMGIVNPKKKQFAEYYRETLSRLNDKDIKKIMKDQASLYEEVFADMGMCRTFGFTAYGYFMYTIHISMKERGIPADFCNELMRDRLKVLLIAVYFKDINMDDNWKCRFSESTFCKSLESYWNDLRDSLKKKRNRNKCPELVSLLECSCFWNVDEELVRAVLNGVCHLSRNERIHLEILRWMIMLCEDLDLEDYASDMCMEMLIEHIRKSYEGMSDISDPSMEKPWFEICGEDKSIKDIGEYFNSYCHSMVMESDKSGRCITNQNVFVAKNYAQMFEVVHNVRCNWEKNKEENLLDMLFQCDFTKGDNGND